MAIIRNNKPWPVDLSGGRFLAPLETGNFDLSAQHEQDLLNEGIISIVDPNVSPPPPLVTGSPKRAVQAFSDLPTTGNERGDTRLVFQGLLQYAWDGTAWQLAAGAGGVGETPGSGQNLYVQTAPPDLSTLTVNTFYIPTNVDGTPKAVDQWEAYTGYSSGDGGDLFVQESAPSPLIDALWVPLNPDGSPKYLDEWIVFTGRGSALGVGNPNLYIGQTQPVNPVVGSLYIPLDTNEVALTKDNWKVYI